MTGERITSWTLQDAARRYRARNVGEKITLIVVVDYIGLHDDEWSCWPGYERIAFDTQQDRSTVRRHLSNLEADGVIRRRSQGKVGGGRGPTLILLDVDRLLQQEVQPAPFGREQTAHPTGGKRLNEGEANGSIGRDAPYVEVPGEPPVEHHASVTALHADDPFDAFWLAYPKKADKGAARRAWKTAIKKVDPLVIVEGARRYAADGERTGRERQFTKNPSTWLNAEAWDNEPEPMPGRGRAVDGGQTPATAIIERMKARREGRNAD